MHKSNYLNLLPVGLVGELLIGGECLARGYLNQPEMTADKFIPNPCQSIEERLQNYNNRVYKTGDLVRWLPDGNLEYIGRSDFQVKIRGYRIELGEIEKRLQAIDGINQVLVLALTDANQSKFLCAYYTGTEFQYDDLAAVLSQQLASYMLPDHFIHLDKFPLTVNGKVDRRALPLPDVSNLGGEYIAPRTETEMLICSEFANILGLEQVGINDDFYRIGGNSIRTIALVSRLQQHFQINVADVFKLKTPLNLAKLLQASSNLTILPTEPRECYPLLPAQERVFLANQIDNNSLLYNIPFRIKLHGDVDRERLGRALDALCSRHIILNNRIVIKDSQLRQMPHFQELTKEFQTASVNELDKLFIDFVQPFNLVKDQLLRIKLVKDCRCTKRLDPE